MDLEEFNRHFSDEYTKKIKQFARRAFLAAGYNYLIVPNKENKERAYCTHCGKWVKIPENNVHTGSPKYLRSLRYDPRSSAKIQTCPSCRKKFNVYHQWRMDLSILNSTISISIWARSKKQKDAIVMRRIEVDRIFDNNTNSVHFPDCCIDKKMGLKDIYSDAERYLFRMGKKGIRAKQQYVSSRGMCFINNIVDSAGYRRSFMNPDPLRGKYFMDMNSFKKAIGSTTYRYCAYEKLNLNIYLGTGYPELLIPYMNLYSMKPWIEVLVKNSLGSIIINKLTKRGYSEAIKWRAKSFSKAVSNFKKQDLKDILQVNGFVEWNLLTFLLEGRKIFSDFSVSTAIAIKRNSHVYGLIHQLRQLRLNVRTSFVKFENYTRKHNKLLSRNQKWTTQMFLTDWLDYIIDAQNSGMDLNDPKNLWPKNLPVAHENIQKERKIKENRLLNERLGKTLLWRRELFSFQNKKYFIRPVESIEELIEEGMKLHHCVSGYAERYASGSTNILVLRKCAAASQPFVTIEVQKDENDLYQLVQVRGNMNNRPPEDAMKFAEKFIQIVNREKKERVKIA